MKASLEIEDAKITVKQCPSCGETKPINCFNKAAREKDGHAWQCRDCLRITHRKYYEKNKTRLNLYRKEWTSKNREKQNSYSRITYRRSREEYLSVNKLKRDIINWAAKFEGCRICGTHESSRFHWHHPFQDEKSFSISFFCRRTWKVILKEMLKCHVLCARCHMQVHRALEGCAVKLTSSAFDDYMLEVYDIEMVEVN